MDLRVIRYRADGNRSAVVGQVVDDAALRPLATRTATRPEVFVVSISAVDLLRAQSWVSEVEPQPEKVELARRLLGVPGTPLIEAKYTRLGTLNNGIWKFLDRAEAAGETKVYFVAVPAEIFEPKWRIACPDGWVSASAQIARPAEPPAVVLPPPTFDGSSAAAEAVRAAIGVLARLRCPVLISGPPGCGRLLAAVVLHHSGPNRGRLPQHTCVQVPRQDQRRQLFGVRLGSVLIPGLLQMARGTTAIVQDFEWLPLSIQAELVAACVGPDAPLDVRLVFISRFSLATLIEQRRVHPDLAALLRDAEIRIPSLALRPEDRLVIARKMWRDVTGGRGGELPDEVLDEIRRQVFPNEADELYAVLVTLWQTTSQGAPTVTQFSAALKSCQRERPAYSTPSGILYGIELDPTASQLAHLKLVSDAFGELWAEFRPIRQEYAASLASIITSLGAIEVALDTLDHLCRDPLRFERAALFHDLIDFMTDLAFVHHRAIAEPGLIAEVWKAEYKLRLEAEHRRLDDQIIETRDRLNRRFPFRQ
ncbi:MAG: sigma 54-interacting transcriptional regulator [Gemmatimonadales bacterium]